MNNLENAKTWNIRKRVASMLMALLFTFTYAFENQYNAYADSDVSEANTIMDTDMDISGSNSFGNLVADGLMAKNSEQLENNGCNVFSVDMDGTVAAVSFETTSDCTLIVGIYDNDGENMLAFGSAEVIAEETEAYVDIITESMPDYFYIRAYLVDTDTLRPLCSEYTSPMYTRSMQEFLSKTTDDFDPDRVMNLDDNKDTNFAVFSESTKLIPTVENVNEVVSANVETQEYVFANADENITSLEAGDIFAYNYGDEVLIVKVGTINVEGSDVTIIGQDTELEDVFEHLRIDGTSPTESADVDISDLEDGISYLGCTEDTSEVSSYGIDIGGKVSYTHKFEFGKTENEYKDDYFTDKYSFTGSLDLKIEASAKVYVSWSETYFEIKLELEAKLAPVFSGEASRKSIALAHFDLNPVAGVFIHAHPSLIIEAKAECKSDVTFSWTAGFRASTSSGKQNLTSNPKITLNSEATVTVFVGFSLEPELTILHEKIANAELKGEAGVEIKATVVKMSTDSKGVQHDCESCIDGDVTAKVDLTATIKLLNKESMKFDFKMVDVKIHLMDFYYSFDFKEWGLKECPHISYPVKVRVISTKSQPISKAKIISKDQERTAMTDESGNAVIMLSPGVQKLSVTADGYREKSATVLVNKFLKSAKVKMYAIGENTPIEEFKQFLYDGIKNGASDPENVDYVGEIIWSGSEIIPEEVRELKFKQVSSKGINCAAITTNGELYTWGINECGQLGNDTTIDSSVPIKIMDNVDNVSFGGWDSHATVAAVTTNGELYIWGANGFGQVGDGTTEERHTPVKIMDNVASVSLGGFHSAAITTSGELYAWGRNRRGQLGNGTTTDSLTPIKILDNISTVSLGWEHSAAITTNKELFVWGANNFGQVGDGITWESLIPSDRHSPIKTMDNVVAVSLGEQNGAAITTQGRLYTWGQNDWGQLGNGTVDDFDTANVKPIKIMDNVASVSMGRAHSAAVTTNGELYAWGLNSQGRLGDGTTTNRLVPTKIRDNIASVSLGSFHSAAITTNGELYTWGCNEEGQLGNGTKKDSLVPQKIIVPDTSSQELVSNLFSIHTYSSGSPKTFSGLIPNEVYNCYVVTNRFLNNILSDENLLYIGQTVSDSNGTLVLPNYLPDGEIFVKAMTKFDVYNADITSAETENKTVSLTWNPVDGADEYEVISFSENGVVSYPKTSDTYISIDNLEGGDYGFVVTSIVYGEQSVPAMNDIVLVRVDEPVQVPALTVTDDGGKALLSWEEIDNALAYKVYSYEDGEYKLLAFTAENSYTVQNLSANTKYGFIVSACVNDVWSELNENDVVYITLGSHTHNYGTEWKYDIDNHWHECACGNKTDIASHEFDDDGQCSVCGANMVKQTVVVTFPESVIVTTSLDAIVHNGDKVNTGDKLRIEAIIPEGKKLVSLTVNGTEIENGSTYIVGTEDVVIAVTFDDVTEPPAEIFITIPENVAVTRDGVAVNNGDELRTGDELVITAAPPENYTLASLKVNGEEFENGGTYMVKDENVVITVEFIPTLEEKLTVTFPENVIVTRTEKILSSGDEVFTGDVLVITAVPPEGYKLNLLTVNGIEIPNESRYTVGSESIVIKAEFAEDTVIITPVSIKIATLPSKTSYYLNEAFKVNGCSIDVTFSDGSVKNTAVTDDMISGFDSNTTGTKTITVTYEGLTAAFEVTVKRRPSGASGTPSRPHTPSEPDDNTLSSGELDSWSDVAEALPGYSGKTLTVNINDDNVVPAVVIKALYDNNATLRAVTKDGYTWIIEGGKVNGLISAIDLEIGVGGYIPSYLIENIGGADAKRLNIKFDNQHKATLLFAVDPRYSGQYASLMRVNDGLSELEFVGSCVVGADGSVSFTPDKAGDYIVIVDTETKLFCDVNNDGVLDTNDVSDLLRYIVGLLDSPNRRNLDHNGDNMVNANDAAYIFKKFEDENELV